MVLSKGLNEMVVELCSENCGVVVSMSPRISFSQDFSQTGGVIPVEKHPLRSNSSGLNSSIDFDFCVHESSHLESSSADELFSHGIILPTQIKKNNNNVPLKQKNQQATQQEELSLPIPPLNDSTIKNNKKVSNNEEVFEKQSSNSKSFWSFKRSSSCGNGYGSSLCPLPLLSRSNSTGSSTSVKKMSMPMSKESANVKQHSTKQRSSCHSFGSINHQKPPLKRSYGGAYGNSVGVSPVLNVPSLNLFGFGSIFSNNNKDKSKKK